MKNFLIQESAMSMMPQISKRNENTIEFVAVLQEANRPNRNGRIYRKEVLEQALAAPYVQERLRTNSMYSEAGHPTDTSVQRQMTIDQRNIACLIKEFWWEGDLLKAKVETANTAIGRDMKGLIEQGSRVAFSLRAQGNVHHDPMLNATIVDSPIQIATYDWVVNPSHDKAFLESICEATSFGLFGSKQTTSLMLSESVNLFENGNLISLTEVVQPVVVDYAKNYGLKFKPLSEAYIYEKGDRLTASGKIATVVNDNVTKKVVLEDFLLKDLRHKIARLTEEEMVIQAPEEEVEEFVLPTEGKFRMANKTKPVQFSIYDTDGSEESLEGPINYKKGDYRVMNPGEAKFYVNAPEHFQRKYKPIPGSNMAEVIPGNPVTVYPITKKHRVPLYGGTSTVVADPELDMVLHYGMTPEGKQNFGVIKKTSFDNTYEYLPDEPGVVKEEEAHISGQDVSKKEAEAVKPVEVLDNTGAIVKVEADDHTEVVAGVIKIKDHDHASEEGAKVRDALHESDHKDEDEPRNADEVAKGLHPVHSEVVNGEIEVEDHDHADAEGAKVRDAVLQEKRKLPEALKKNMHDDPTDGDKIPETLEKNVYARKGEKYTKEELKEAFEALELDTNKYTFEFLAEQLGFEQLEESGSRHKLRKLEALDKIAGKETDPYYKEKLTQFVDGGNAGANLNNDLKKDVIIDSRGTVTKIDGPDKGKRFMQNIKPSSFGRLAAGANYDKAREYKRQVIKSGNKETTDNFDFVKNNIKLPFLKEETYTQKDLLELFEALELDTNKYTFEFLAEQLGFETIYPSEKHTQEVDVDSKELGGEPSNARVAAQKPAKAGETVESSEEIESEKLGGEPTDARVKGSKPAKAGETLHHAEEVKAVIVESAKVKLGNIKVKGGK